MPLMVPDAISVATANLIKGYALSQFPDWRPFAYKFNGNANVMKVDSISEDFISINGAFGRFRYKLNTPAELNQVVSETYTINGKFGFAELNRASQFDVIGEGHILTATSPVTLTVYYLFSSGIRSVEMNEKLLDTAGDTLVVSSRHTSLAHISYELGNLVDGTRIIYFSSNDDSVVSESISKISQVLANFPEVPSSVALSVANLIRSFALSQFKSWRPFAYKFDSRASVLTVDSVKEDPISINGAFGKMRYELPESVAFNTVVYETYNINGEFSAKELRASSKFNIVGEGKILTSLSPMSLKVYYLYSEGLRTEEQNRNLITADTNMVIVSSRHTSLESISYRITDRGDGKSLISFNTEDPGTVSRSVEGLLEIFSSGA